MCCTLNQWFLHFEAVGGVCMPTNECSKGGELSATGHLSNSTPNHDHTHATCLQIRQTLPPTVLLCSPNKRLFVPKVLWVPLDLSEYRFWDIDPQGLSNMIQHSCALFCNVSIERWITFIIGTECRISFIPVWNFAVWLMDC